MRGYAWGAASVLLVTLAQLLMKWGMSQIPLMSFADVTLSLFSQYWLPLLAVSGGFSAMHCQCYAGSSRSTICLLTVLIPC